jgi:hypothetical protein
MWINGELKKIYSILKDAFHLLFTQMEQIFSFSFWPVAAVMLAAAAPHPAL